MFEIEKEKRMMDENKFPEEQNGLTPDTDPQAQPPVPEEPAPQAPAGEAPAQEPAPAERREYVVDGGPAVPDGEPQKKSKLPVVLIVVIAVLVVAAVAAFASGIFMSPERAVNKAFEATAASDAKFADKLKKELPVYSVLYGAGGKASSTDFDFTVDSLEVSGVAADELNLVNNLLKGSGLRGTFVSDPANEVVELDGALHMGVSDLLDFYAYLSPDKAAFSVPSFSDTAVSLNPQTIAEDLQKSPLGQDMTAEDAKMMQDSVNAVADLLGAYAKMDPVAMEADLKPILDKVRSGAAYEKAGKEGAITLYTMKIPGENVKTLVAELIRYLYVDSPLGEAMESIFNIMPEYERMGYASWGEFLDGELLNDMLKEMPPIPLNVTVKVGSGKIIRGMDIAAELPPELVAAGLETFTASYQVDGDNVTTGSLNLTGTSEGQPVSIVMDLRSGYLDGTFDTVMDMKMDLGADAYTGMPVRMNLTETVTMDRDGGFQVKAVMAMPEMVGPGQDVNCVVDVAGTITVDGDNVSYDFPTFGLSVDAAGEQIKLNFNASAKSGPVQTPYEMSRPSKDLFSMTEQELQAEMQKYVDGMNALVGKAFSIMMGAGGTPELGPTPAA